MLAEHGVNIDAGANVLGGINLPDGDRAAPIAGVDLSQILRRCREYQCSRHGITSDAAAETVALARRLAASMPGARARSY